jgi:hypothetical protein
MGICLDGYTLLTFGPFFSKAVKARFDLTVLLGLALGAALAARRSRLGSRSLQEKRASANIIAP